MDAYFGMGDNFDEHCLDYSDAEDPSGSSRVSGGYHDWSLPDGGYSSPVASAVPALSRNVVVTAESLRGRRLNDKLYALRSVVPNITKMDKVSIIKDAVEYVQRLQEEERWMLAEISILESAAPAAHGQRGAPTVVTPDSCPHHADAVPPMKKMRSFLPSSSAVTPGASAMAATSRRIEDLEVRVTGAGDKVLLVSVACRYRKDAIAKVCLALDGLGLPIISSNVSSASGTLKHTALVQGGEMHQSEMKQVIETAISQVDAFGSTTMCY